MRALAYVRLSKLTEVSTSPERQAQAIASFISTRPGWELVDTIADLDVSATKQRLDRPGLNEVRRRLSADEADAVVVYRLDRIARNVGDVSTLLDEGIMIVSATESFDTTTASGRAMVQVAQVFAELEATTIGLRVSSARKHLPTVGRWPGGPTPYGFTTANVEGGAGRTLVHDEHEAPIVRRMVEEVLAGTSVLEVTQRLNADGIAPRRGAEWSRTVVARLLRSGTLRGYATSGGAKSPGRNKQTGEAMPQKRGDKVRDERGIPAVVWPPLVTPEEARALDKTLAVGASSARTLHDEELLLIGLAICSSCGRKMTPRAVKRPSRSDAERRLNLYVCHTRNRGGQCSTPQTISAHLADEAAERQFLRAFGCNLVTETLEEAVEPADLPEVLAAIDETTDAMREPGADLAALASLLGGLALERDRLTAQPRTRAVYRVTDESYADLWERSTVSERRKLMLGAEAYVSILPAERRGYFTTSRVQMLDHLAGHFD